jgi:DNA-binding FadR family transcriptional regulator
VKSDLTARSQIHVSGTPISLQEVTVALADHAFAAQWKPLARTRTHEQVIAEIETRLLAGIVKVGDRLPPERQFAEALGVSRGAVREALRILEAMGIVEAGTGSGPSAGSLIVRDSVAGLSMVLRLHLQVAAFSQDDLGEVGLGIACQAARKAVESASPEDVAGLQAIVEEMRRTKSSSARSALETAFHRQLARATGNALTVVLIEALHETRLGSDDWPGDRDPLEPISLDPALVYAGIVRAIMDGDRDSAAKLVMETFGRTTDTDGINALMRVG